jgi:DNA-binding winged helix-turn-helix (wHTH) protein
MNPTSTPPGEIFRFGNCVLCSDTRELLRDGHLQKIERRAFDLIHYLLRQGGRVVGKDELLEQVWHNRFVTESVIAQSVMKARRALGIHGREDGPIGTVHRVGYRFVGDMQRETRPAPVAQVSPDDHDAPVPAQVWMNTRLMSLAAHLLRANGVEIHPDAGGDAAPAARPAKAVVRARMRSHQGRCELVCRVQWDTDEAPGLAMSGAPVEPLR